MSENSTQESFSLPNGGSTGFISRNFSANVSMAKVDPHILMALYSTNFEVKFWKYRVKAYWIVQYMRKAYFSFWIVFLLVVRMWIELLHEDKKTIKVRFGSGMSKKPVLWFRSGLARFGSVLKFLIQSAPT